MAQIKKLMPLTPWFEFFFGEKGVQQIGAPSFKCRLKPVNGFDSADFFATGARKPSDFAFSMAIAAMAEWDLVDSEADNAPVPCSDEKKAEFAGYLHFLLSQTLKKSGDFLATAILEKAQNIENFLKN